MVSVVRDDIASVAARLVTMARPTTSSPIPANGFSLAATVSRPVAANEPPPASGRKPAPVRLPAVVLVSGSAPSDRDEFVAGIPIFAQLANTVADAGYLVVRYDERGAGQSGGRQESATLQEFAADARAVVTYLSKRRDVDPRESPSSATVRRLDFAACRRAGAKVSAIALVATASIPGTELVLEQQRSVFGGQDGRHSSTRSGHRTAEEDLRRRDHRQRVGGAHPRRPAPRRHAVVSQLPPLRSSEDDGARPPAAAGRTTDARSRDTCAARRAARTTRAVAPPREIDRFRAGARCQSPARAGRHRRCRRIRHARAAGRQRCRHVGADLLARQDAATTAVKVDVDSRDKRPVGGPVRFRLPPVRQDIGRSTGAEFIVDAALVSRFTATAGNGRFSRGQGSRRTNGSSSTGSAFRPRC